MKNQQFLAIVLIGIFSVCQAQENLTLQVQKEAMIKLEILEGNWKGSGWMMTREGRQTFTQTEEVELATGGITLLVKGKGTNEEGVLVHDALGVFYFNPESNQYEFQAHVAKGYHTNAWAKYEEGSIIWGYDHPYAGSMKYTISINNLGQWVEIGEMSRDGNEWMQIFEMTLSKVN